MEANIVPDVRIQLCSATFTYSAASVTDGCCNISIVKIQVAASFHFLPFPLT